MHFGAIANSARGGPPRPPPVRDRVKGPKSLQIGGNSYLNQEILN